MKFLIPCTSSPPLHAHGCFSTRAAYSSSPLILSGFFNEMLAVSESEALNFYTFFCLIPSTLFVSTNLTLTHLPLFDIPGFSALRSDCIPSRSGILSPDTTHASSASSFSSGRAYLSLNFLPPLFLRLIPTLIM